MTAYPPEWFTDEQVKAGRERDAAEWAQMMEIAAVEAYEAEHLPEAG